MKTPIALGIPTTKLSLLVVLHASTTIIEDSFRQDVIVNGHYTLQ